MVASRQYHKLGKEIVGQLDPFAPVNSPLLPFHNSRHRKILISVIEQFFSKFEETPAYQYIEAQTFIDDIRLFVPLFPVITSQRVNSHRGPPSFA